MGNPNLSGSQRTFDQYFNVGAFAKPIPINPATCTASGCPPITFLNFGNGFEGFGDHGDDHGGHDGHGGHDDRDSDNFGSDSRSLFS